MLIEQHSHEWSGLGWWLTEEGLESTPWPNWTTYLEFLLWEKFATISTQDGIRIHGSVRGAEKGGTGCCTSFHVDYSLPVSYWKLCAFVYLPWSSYSLTYSRLGVYLSMDYMQTHLTIWTLNTAHTNHTQTPTPTGTAETHNRECITKHTLVTKNCRAPHVGQHRSGLHINPLGVFCPVNSLRYGVANF